MVIQTRIHAAAKYAGLAVCAVLALGGCASSGPARIPSSGSIVVSSDVNPNPEGRPSPVVLRIYELRGASVFRSADFFPLYRNASKTLGRDLLGEQEFELRPGQSRKFTRKLPAGTRFVGVVAAFRDLDKAGWRSLAALPKKKSGWFAHDGVLPVHIRLKRLAVSVSIGKR